MQVHLAPLLPQIFKICLDLPLEQAGTFSMTNVPICLNPTVFLRVLYGVI